MLGAINFLNSLCETIARLVSSVERCFIPHGRKMSGRDAMRCFRAGCPTMCLTFCLGSPFLVSAQAAEIETIRTAVPTIAMNFMHAGVARKLGIDRQEGFALEIILMRVSIAMAALIAGNIDYNFAFESTVNAALQGAPVIGIEVMQDKPPYMVVARPEIHGFADLKGKIVAQNDIFSVAAYVFRQVLRFNGLTDKDYSMISFCATIFPLR